MGEFQGVAQQVDQDLPQPGGVALDQRGQVAVADGLEDQPLRLGVLAHDGGHVIRQSEGIEIELFQFQLAGLDLGHVQDLVDQVQQMGAGLVDDGYVLALGGSDGLILQQLGKTQDGIEGGTQFVAHAGDEIGLGLTGELCLVPGVPHGLPGQQHVLIGGLRLTYHQDAEQGDDDDHRNDQYDFKRLVLAAFLRKFLADACDFAVAVVIEPIGVFVQAVEKGPHALEEHVDLPLLAVLVLDACGGQLGLIGIQHASQGGDVALCLIQMGRKLDDLQDVLGIIGGGPVFGFPYHLIDTVDIQQQDLLHFATHLQRLQV